MHFLGSRLSGLILLFTLTACNLNGDRLGHPFTTTLDQSDGQIVGGKVVLASDRESAYVVMIYGETEENESFVCTGTFITSSVILTAGHCVVDDIAKLTVAFSVDPFNDLNVITLPIEAIVRHEQYKANSPNPSERNDVALIRFTGGLPKGAKLATLPENSKVVAVPEDLLALGYGRTEGREKSENAEIEIGILRSVRMSLDTSTEKFDTHINHLIADQKGNKGVCSGDSGGPLFDTQNNEFTLVGVSSGIFNASDRDTSDSCQQKSLFMNVQFYLDWIRSNISKQAPAATSKESTGPANLLPTAVKTTDKPL